jgi:hypothetical protein
MTTSLSLCISELIIGINSLKQQQIVMACAAHVQPGRTIDACLQPSSDGLLSPKLNRYFPPIVRHARRLWKSMPIDLRHHQSIMQYPAEKNEIEPSEP